MLEYHNFMENTCEKCHNDKLVGLVEKSEARIDRTNEMISKCVSVIDRVTSEYTAQLNELQKNRDALAEENRKLICMLDDVRKDYELLNRKYDSLVDKLLSFAGSRSENNINVK